MENIDQAHTNKNLKNYVALPILKQMFCAWLI